MEKILGKELVPKNETTCNSINLNNEEPDSIASPIQKSLSELKAEDERFPKSFIPEKTTYYPHIDERLRKLLLSLYKHRHRNANFYHFYAALLNGIYTNKASIVFQTSKSSLSKLLIQDKMLKTINSELGGMTYKRFMDWCLVNGLIKVLYPPLKKTKDTPNLSGLYQLIDEEALGLILSSFPDEWSFIVGSRANEDYLNYRDNLINAKTRPQGIPQKREPNNDNGENKESISSFPNSKNININSRDDDGGISIEQLNYYQSEKYKKLKRKLKQ